MRVGLHLTPDFTRAVHRGTFRAGLSTGYDIELGEHLVRIATEAAHLAFEEVAEVPDSAPAPLEPFVLTPSLLALSPEIGSGTGPPWMKVEARVTLLWTLTGPTPGDTLLLTQAVGYAKNSRGFGRGAGNTSERLNMALDSLFYASAGVLSSESMLDRHMAWAPLQGAVVRGDMRAVDSLLASGSEIEAANGRGRTPLLLAVELGKVAMVDHLLAASAAGALSEHRDHQGRTALHYAALGGNPELVDRILTAGVSVDVADREGLTPLMNAVREGHVPTAHMLLAAGASPDVADGEGVTALMIAVSKGHVPMVGALLEAGADPGARNSLGGTALMEAAHAGNLEVVELLLGSDLDPGETATNGADARALAWQAGHGEVARRISRAVGDGVEDDPDLLGTWKTDEVVAYLEELLGIGTLPPVQEGDSAPPVATSSGGIIERMTVLPGTSDAWTMLRLRDAEGNEVVSAFLSGWGEPAPENPLGYTSIRAWVTDTESRSMVLQGDGSWEVRRSFVPPVLETIEAKDDPGDESSAPGVEPGRAGVDPGGGEVVRSGTTYPGPLPATAALLAVWKPRPPPSV